MLRLTMTLVLTLIAVTAIQGCKTPAASGPKITHFYSDLDGTLLNHDSKITPEMKAATERYQASGGKLGVATGRTLDTALGLAQELNVDLPVISANGAVIVSPQGKLIRLLGIENEEDIKSICTVINQGGCNVVYTAYTNPKTAETKIADGVCEPSGDPNWVVTKLRGRDCSKHANLLNKLPSLVDGRYSVVESGTGKWRGMSVGALGVGKDKALQFIAKMVGISLNNLAFVGDSNNDLDAASLVHKEGGLCFAVKNGTPELLKACPRHTKGTNHEGAVIEVIDTLLSKHSR